MNKCRDLVVMLSAYAITKEDVVKMELNFIEKLLSIAESEGKFCQAHEMVIRHKIVQKPAIIKKALKSPCLKGFHFFICKN